MSIDQGDVGQNGDTGKEAGKDSKSSLSADSPKASTSAKSLIQAVTNAQPAGKMDALAGLSITRDVSANLPPGIAKSVYREGRGLAQDHKIFAEHETEHIQRSHDMIKKAAEMAPETQPGKLRKALILGPGPAADIPLEYLATEFDEVTLVELDTERIRDAVLKLPRELQAKCKIIIGDVTGGFYNQYTNDVEAAFQRSTSLDEFIANLTSVTMDAQPKPTQFGGKGEYAFCCSQLVMSQIPYHINNYLIQFIFERFAEEMKGKSSGDYTETLESMKRLVADHLHPDLVGTHMQTVLDAVSQDGGIVYLSDTTSVIETQNISGSTRVTKNEPLYNIIPAKSPVTGEFDVEDVEEWLYPNDPETSEETGFRTDFLVTATILRKNE